VKALLAEKDMQKYACHFVIFFLLLWTETTQFCTLFENYTVFCAGILLTGCLQWVQCLMVSSESNLRSEFGSSIQVYEWVPANGAVPAIGDQQHLHEHATSLCNKNCTRALRNRLSFSEGKLLSQQILHMCDELASYPATRRDSLYCLMLHWKLVFRVW